MDPGAQLEPELRAISDTFMAQLDVVLALEERKRSTPVDAPEFPALAAEVEEAARLLLAQASHQQVTADEVHASASSEGLSATIEEMPPSATPGEILQMWRDADRELAAAAPGSVRAKELRRLSDAYRAAYQRLFEESRKARSD